MEKIENSLGDRDLKTPRMGGDSNPRYLSVNTLSRRAQSTTLPPIHRFDWAEIANFLCRIENGYSGEKSAISKLDLW